MKKTRFLIVAVVVVMLSLATTETMAQTKKQQKRDLVALQIRVSRTLGTINYLNPEYSLEEHAVLLLPKNIELRYALGQTVLLPPGSHSLQFIEKTLVNRRMGVQATWLDKYVTVECTFEAGKYYKVEFDVKAVNFLLKSGSIVELKEEKRLVQTRLEAEDIRKQAKTYFEYMKANPQELNGKFVRRMPHIQFTFDGEQFHEVINVLGMTTNYFGRYWFDGQSVILQVDMLGKTLETAEKTEMIVTQFMYYTMDNGDMVVSTKPITKIGRKTVRYQRIRE